MADHVRFLAQHLLHAGLSPLNARDQRVISRVARRVRRTGDVNKAFDARTTFAQRLADRVASIGGSWTFILCFSAFIVGWALVNVFVLGSRAFDPYPFIFLNLLLSMLAAMQAPIIMMSQNRQAAKDRLAAAMDYEVNLRSEAELAALQEKVDALQSQIAELVRLQKTAIALATGDVVDREEDVGEGRPTLRAA
jgi:uncharacterized membrane protein